MKTRTSLTAATAVAVGAVLLASVPPAAAAHGGLTITGLTANDRLVTFLANNPSDLLSTVKVTGVAGDLAGIDFRVATGALYGVGVRNGVGTIYTIDTDSGVATAVPGGPALPLRGQVSIDVNPAADALRVVDSTGTNLRIPFGGATPLALLVDGSLAYVDGDPNEGRSPQVSGVAYTNNDTDPTTGTVLYDIDAALDQLAMQDPPNAGGLKTVGALSQGTKSAATGFDIYTREAAKGGQTWAFVSLFDKGRTTFYEIDLATGSAKTFPAAPGEPASGTQIGSTPHVTDLAVEPNQNV